MQTPELISEAARDIHGSLVYSCTAWYGPETSKNIPPRIPKTPTASKIAVFASLLNCNDEYRRLLKGTGIDFSADQPGRLIKHKNFTIVRHLHNPTTSMGITETNPEYIQRSDKAGQHTQTLCGEAHRRIEPILFGHLEYYGRG